MLTESDIEHLIYIVGESKKKCLDDGSVRMLKEEAMRYSLCSKLYTKLNIMKDAYIAYEIKVNNRGEYGTRFGLSDD